MNQSTYSWQQIHEVPSQPGIYSWYLKLKIPLKEIMDFKLLAENIESTVDTSRKGLHDLLCSNLLLPYKELDYSVSISGELKPRYKGIVEQEVSMHNEFLDRLISSPQKLDVLGKTLTTFSTGFLRPIYIGKSDNLCRRLKEHKTLILKLYEESSRRSTKLEDSKLTEAEKCFAGEVVKRGYSPDSLFVSVLSINSENYYKDLEADLEYILNRINYPLLGRR